MRVVVVFGFLWEGSGFVLFCGCLVCFYFCDVCDVCLCVLPAAFVCFVCDCLLLLLCDGVCCCGDDCVCGFLLGLWCHVAGWVVVGLFEAECSFGLFCFWFVYTYSLTCYL